MGYTFYCIISNEKRGEYCNGSKGQHSANGYQICTFFSPDTPRTHHTWASLLEIRCPSLLFVSNGVRDPSLCRSLHLCYAVHTELHSILGRSSLRIIEPITRWRWFQAALAAGVVRSSACAELCAWDPTCDNDGMLLGALCKRRECSNRRDITPASQRWRHLFA